MLLLLLGGMANDAWAYKITYHILTLPMTSERPGNTMSDYYGWRMEALRVIVDNVTTLQELPAHFQSPLAENFKYYANASVTKDGTARSIYANHTKNKYFLYKITGEDTPTNEDDVLPMSIGDPITSHCDIYVTYDYKVSNTIAKLDGSEKYIIGIHGGFLAYNKGRNNRLASIPKKYDGEYIVDGESLCSDDFNKINLSGKGTGITTWWNGNKTPQATADSYFHFMFKYVGSDPYNITIKTAYEGDDVYYEKWGSDPSEMKRYYKEGTVFSTQKITTDQLLIASDDNKKYTIQWNSSSPIHYDDMPGYYRNIDGHLWNSFALLNNTKNDGYVYIGTRCVDGNGNISNPSNNQYYYLYFKSNNELMFGLMNAADATTKSSVDKKMYDVFTYTFHVTTPFGHELSAEKNWPEPYMDVEILPKHVPTSLLRKYCSIVGFYKDAALTQPITTFGDATDKHIYVKYEVSGAPFKAISRSASYTTATWYELTDAGSSQSDGKKLKWDGSANFKNNGPAGKYERESEFAFVGDPYELRVIYRDATETNGGKRYVGAATVSSGTALTFSPTDDTDGYKWEIPADDIDGSFELRQYGSSASTPMYWQWTTASAGNNVNIATSSTRVKVMELQKIDFTFKVVDLAGRIAIQATEALLPFTKLNGYNSIPASIRSPFLADETVTFYDSYEERDGVSGLDRRDWHNPSEQTPLTELPGASCDIYVSYTTANLGSKNIKLIYNEQFNVKLNGEYIYWDSSTGKILSEALPPNSLELNEGAYSWHLRGRDPYAMRIDNVGASVGHTEHITINVYDTSGNGSYTTESDVNNGMFVRVKDGTWGDNKELTFIADRDQASRFVVMMSNYTGVYEVLAATGTTDQYRLGRVSTAGAETKVYANSTYAHGADQLRFELASKTLVTYHLIDKSGDEIFKNEISSYNPRLALPSDYVSPLVEEYYYYPTSSKAGTNLPGDRITEVSQDESESGEESGSIHIYVTYIVSDRIGFGTSNPHMLRFHNGQSYYLEDGADKLDTSGKIQAVYPYCNGDGNLNIYGSDMNEEQMEGGSSTRPRWVWFIESENHDPYHVKIHSKSTISFNGTSNSTYLRTYAVHFDQETDKPNKQRIVTGGHFPGISGQPATEYAILGVTGRYKLLTTNKIAADLDGSGVIEDSEKQRHYVTSFEQYWKTYNMVRQYILGDARVNKNDPDAFNDPIIMPAERWSELKTKLTAKGVDDEANRVDGCSWHSYEAIASAVRWNGYSDLSGSDGYEKKKVERLQHWFQTFDMGDGTFDIESADIPAVLVLLDRHGWEIMRKPIPTGTTDAEAEAKLAVLRAYDSPMVKEYTFYSQATKLSGCHKFTLRMQNGKERDTIAVNGKRYQSTSLGTLPPYKADRDLFVTYSVKEEYDKSYDPSTATASKFIVLQNHTYASDEETSEGTNNITANTVTYTTISKEIMDDANREVASKTFKQKTLWYVQPNPDIDSEMGYPGDFSALSYTDEQNGFDPYNIQFKNAYTSKFFTIGMTRSILEGGQYNGDYTGSSTNVTLAAAITGNSRVDSPESYDHSTLHMTNQTFMAVQDVNGNMQIMPRFDHNRRIEAFATLVEPKTHAADAVDDASPGEQTTFMVRPVVHDYRILDNNGNIAMRYLTGGEFYPSMPEHFKSPLAKDFKYYSGHATTGEVVSSTLSEWDAATGVFKKTATSAEDMNTQVKSLTVSGTYYFRIAGTGDSPTYTYKKVSYNANTTTSSNGIYSDVANHVDISNREITSSFAAAGVTYDSNNKANVYIRYEYDESVDTEHDNVLQGRWMTVSLGNNSGNLQWIYYSGQLNSGSAGIYTGTKPATSNDLKNARQWHWKFLASPMVETSERYKAPDPYAVEIYNREANNSVTGMSTPVTIEEVNRFVILSHPDGDYALVKASDDINSYSFLNGSGMTVHNAGSAKSAKIVVDGSFSTSNSDISDNARVIFENDITHTYTYRVITDASHQAAYESQEEAIAISRGYEPVIPEAIQTPLLNLEDYLYYGTASLSADVFSIDLQSQLKSLYGLYEDEVYVHYLEFDRDNTPYLVPNKKDTSSGHVDRHDQSNDVAIDISGKLPYNIIWYDDNMMSFDGLTISDGGSRDLNGDDVNIWYFEGSDPYDIKIKKTTDKYVDGTDALNATAKSFMLLKKDDYDYGVFAETGNQGTMLSGYGQTTATSDPTHFIIFALSTHKLIYHLVINTSNVNTRIPYRPGTEEEPGVLGYEDIPGTTQRDLTSVNDGAGTHYAGEKYQLGETILGQTYCVDAGQVSIGDDLDSPTDFDRPNCVYFYYIDDIQTKGDISTYQKTADDDTAMETSANVLTTEDYYYYKIGNGPYTYKRVHVTTAYDGENNAIYTVVACTEDEYNNCWQDNTKLNGKYRGLKVTKLMSDTELIGSVVKVNVTYGFDQGLDTNAGDGFVTSVSQNKWFTFETKDGPYLAHYTNAWGLQAMEGRNTRYTNDYLWTPVGDVYGFTMYNRYVYKTSNETTRVMTTESFAEGKTLKMAVPGSTITNENNESVTATTGNEVYELLANETTTPGYFLIHPVINDNGTKYYIKRNTASGDKMNYAILSETPSEWTFGLTEDLVKPYYDRAGYVGGLTKDGKTAYEAASTLQAKQAVVYNDANIVPYTKGYYRLHNQPDVSGLKTVRYASGYLHDIEKTAVSGGIPMHFYSKKSVNTTFEGADGLGSGFTKTAATRGAIPVPATEYDPSTIFYFDGETVNAANHPISKMSTQGLYVKGVQKDDDHGDAVMTDTESDATPFTIMDIGGAVFLIHDGSLPDSRNYLHFSQSYEVSSVNMIYDLKYFHNSPTDDAKWCLEPANNQGLMIATNDGGDGFFYSTFCAPFDVEMPKNDGSNTYYAYVSDEWGTEVIHPTLINESGTYAKGKFVPAGTPVIIRTTDNTGKIKLTLHTPKPTTPAVSCIFTGKYLEQLLDEVTASDKLYYTFGLPITGYTGVTYTTGTTNGEILNIVGRDQAVKGVGFYINATQNKEKSEESGQWTPNNRYVIHNKIYYRDTSSGSRELTRSPEFIPVVFDDEDDDDEELQPDGSKQAIAGDNRVYDLQGRCVATEEMVKDGTWRHNLKHGIYILNGKKVYVK